MLSGRPAISGRGAAHFPVKPAKLRAESVERGERIERAGAEPGAVRMREFCRKIEKIVEKSMWKKQEKNGIIRMNEEGRTHGTHGKISAACRADAMPQSSA